MKTRYEKASKTEQTQYISQYNRSSDMKIETKAADDRKKLFMAFSNEWKTKICVFF